MFIGLMIFNDFHLVRYLFYFNLFSQYFDFEVSSFLLAIKMLNFSSPEPTAQVSFSDHNLSVFVCVIKFSYFLLLLQNHCPLANLDQTWPKVFLGNVDSSLLK